MGVVKLTLQMVFYTLVAALMLMSLPTSIMPPNYKFEPVMMRPPRKLEGKLTPNDILDKAELVFDGDFVGPESVAVRGDKVFTGVASGDIISVDVNKKGVFKKVAKLKMDCDGSYKSPCPRPLGLRFNKEGKLLVADAFAGIYEVDVDSGATKVILPTNLPDQSKNNPVSKLNFVDDLDIDNDGIIYFSDASQTGTLTNMFPEVLGDPTGRLLAFNPKTKNVDVLIDGLHFANGVQLSRKEDFVVVSESMRSKVWKYYLKGPKKGVKEVMLEGLPGIPDNIRSNGKGGFYISLVMPDTEDVPNGLRKTLPLPSVRKLILRLQLIFHKIVETADNILPNPFFKMAHNSISALGPVFQVLESFSSNKVIIVEVDETGNIVGNLQNKVGNIAKISEIGIGEKWTYFGSPSENKLWRIKTEYLF